jgi:hypothetical protein
MLVSELDISAHVQALSARYGVLLEDVRSLYGKYVEETPAMQALIQQQQVTPAQAIEGLLGAFVAYGLLQHAVPSVGPFVTVQGLLEALLAVSAPGDLQQCLNQATQAHAAVENAAATAQEQNLSPEEAFKQALEQMSQIRGKEAT